MSVISVSPQGRAGFVLRWRRSGRHPTQPLWNINFYDFMTVCVYRQLIASTSPFSPFISRWVAPRLEKHTLSHCIDSVLALFLRGSCSIWCLHWLKFSEPWPCILTYLKYSLGSPLELKVRLCRFEHVCLHSMCLQWLTQPGRVLEVSRQFPFNKLTSFIGFWINFTWFYVFTTLRREIFSNIVILLQI